MVEPTADSWVKMPANKRRREALDRWDVNAFLLFISLGGLFGWQIDRKGESEWMQAFVFAVVITGYSMLRVCIRSLPVLSDKNTTRIRQLRPKRSSAAQVRVTIRQDGVVTGEDEGWFSCDHQGLEFVGLRSRVAVPRCLITNAELRRSWLGDRLRCEVELPDTRASVRLDFVDSGGAFTRLREIAKPPKLVRSTVDRDYEDTIVLPMDVQEDCRFDWKLFLHELASGCVLGFVMWSIICYDNPSLNTSQLKLSMTLIGWIFGGVALTSFGNLYRGWRTRRRMLTA